MTTERWRAACLALATHAEARPIKGDIGVIGEAWQLAASLIELCDRERVSFEEIVEDARDFVESTRADTWKCRMSGPKPRLRSLRPISRRHRQPRPLPTRIERLIAF